MFSGAFCAKSWQKFIRNVHTARRVRSPPINENVPSPDVGPRTGKLFDALFYASTAPIPGQKSSVATVHFKENKEKLISIVSHIPVLALPDVDAKLELTDPTLKPTVALTSPTAPGPLPKGALQKLAENLPTSQSYYLRKLQLEFCKGEQPPIGQTIVLIQNVGMLGRADLALLLFAQCAQNEAATVPLYCALLFAFAQAKRMDLAEQAIQDMKFQGLTPCIVAWTCMLQGYLKQGNMRALWRTYEGMRRYANIEPDEIVFTILIKACKQENLVEKGLGLFEEMENVHKLPPLERTFNAVLLLLGRRRGLLREQEEMLMRMEGYGFKPGFVAMRTVMRNAAKGGDLRRIRRYLDMCGRLDIRLTADIFAATILAFARAQTPNSVYRQQLEGEDVDLEFLRSEADRIYKTMQEEPHNVKPTWPVLDALLASRTLSPTATIEDVERIVTEEYQRHGVKPRSSTARLLIAFYSRQSDPEKCEALFAAMIRHNMEPEPLSALYCAVANIRGGRPGGLERAFKWVDLLEARGHPLTPEQVDLLRREQHRSRFKRETVLRRQAAGEREGLATDPEPLRPPPLTLPRTHGADAVREGFVRGDPMLRELTTPQEAPARAAPSTGRRRGSARRREQPPAATPNGLGDGVGMAERRHYRFREQYWGTVDAPELAEAEQPRRRRPRHGKAAR